jgi:hypothetical protein
MVDVQMRLHFTRLSETFTCEVAPWREERVQKHHLQRFIPIIA